MTARLFTLWVWATALLCLPLETAAAPTTNCTDASFQTPAWAVQDVHYSSRLKSGSLRVTNRANNFSLTIICTAGECSPETVPQHDDPNTQLAIAMIRGSLEITVNQTWTCNDRRWKDVPISLNFTATGKTSLPAQCDDQGACRPISQHLSLIRGSLLAPIAGTPRYLDPLPGQGLTKCKPVYTDQIWHSRNLKYWERIEPCFENCEPTSADLFPPNGATVEFDLYNYILNQTVHCSGVLFNNAGKYPTQKTKIDCVDASGAPSARKYSTRTTVISFGRPFIWSDFGMLSVNQTWQCDENGPDKPTEVNAYTTGQIFLVSCKHTNGTIDHNGRSYPWSEMACDGGDRYLPYPYDSISPAVGQAYISSVDLPTYALEEPLQTPRSGSCLTRHLQTTGWDVSSVDMVLNYTDPETGKRRDTAVVKIGFVANVAQLKAGKSNSLEVPLLEGSKNATDGNKWIDCYLAGDSTTAPCRFQFDSARRRLTVARLTKCDDVDGVHPYQVTIKASYTVPTFDCAWRSRQGASERHMVVRCGWQADLPNQTMMTVDSLGGITWEAIPQGWGANIWDGLSPSS